MRHALEKSLEYLSVEVANFYREGKKSDDTKDKLHTFSIGLAVCTHLNLLVSGFREGRKPLIKHTSAD